METLSEVHRRCLEQWRTSMNLIGPGDAELHFEDSRRAIGWLGPWLESGTWVDLGTGAGFPGLVFADRFPEVPLELVDSRRKRCVFVQHVLREAPPRSAALRVRCERVEALEPQRYAGVLSRAFAPPPTVLDHAARLLRPGGRVVLLLQRGDDVPQDPRFETFHIETYAVHGKRRQAVGLVLGSRST